MTMINPTAIWGWWMFAVVSAGAFGHVIGRMGEREQSVVGSIFMAIVTAIMSVFFFLLAIGH